MITPEVVDTIRQAAGEITAARAIGADTVAALVGLERSIVEAAGRVPADSRLAVELSGYGELLALNCRSLINVIQQTDAALEHFGAASGSIIEAVEGN